MLRMRVIIGSLLCILLISCGMNDSRYMSSGELRQFETAYSGMQEKYQSLISEYQAKADTLPQEVQVLYGDLQKMYEQMDYNHQQMIARNRARNEQGDKKMVSDKLRMHIQSHMVGEWYHQMKGMHQKLGNYHRDRNHPLLAKLNKEIVDAYANILDRIPGLDEAADVPFNAQGNPSILNGKRLYVQNCASCHGGEGQGIADIFPPLVNSEWVTGDKSTALRILLNGLEGEVSVREQTYSGYMPSFKARLSAAEMAAILNHLRTESKDSLSVFTQDDVIRIGKTYGNRTSPWHADELRKNSP